MASKKIMASALAGLALCMLACSVQAAGLYGTYSYKLVLRDVDFAIAMGTDPEMNKIGDTYAIEVYNASGVKIGSKIRDDFLISSSVGYNCILEVDMASGSDPVSGYANSGDQLTLVVTYIGENLYVAKGTEVFRSSKILPPVGDWGDVAKTPVGVFYSGPGDTDAFYDEWAYTIGLYCDAYGGEFAGARDSDDDGDGLSNLREYQFGTDPTGGTFNEAAEAFEMGSYVNRPEVGITEQDGGFKVSFNYGVYHVYSVRVIEGTDTVGAAGEDLALYTSLANLNGCARVCQSGYNAQKHRLFDSLGVVERLSYHVVGFLLVRRFENWNHGKFSVEARVLLVLRRVHRRVIGSKYNQAAVYACYG